VAVLVHGLGGSASSSYLVRVARRLESQGILTVRVNLRGAGEGAPHARLPYHSGRSEDVRAVGEWLHRRFPSSPVTVLGFSLGANIALKLAAEMGEQRFGSIDSFVAVSPPVDLEASCRKIALRPVLDRFFVDGLRRHVAEIHRHFPELHEPRFPKRMTLMDFDEAYTAPRGGFMNARDYYARSSSGPLVASIRAPTLLLYAEDDPLIDTDALRALRSRSQLDVVATPQGGHVAFLGNPLGGRPFRWMDELLLRWVQTLRTAP